MVVGDGEVCVAPRDCDTGSFRLWVLLGWVQCCCRGWNVWLRSVLLSTLFGGEWSASRPSRSITGENPRYQFYSRLNAHHSQVWKGEYFLASQTVEPRAIWMGVSFIGTGEPTCRELWGKLELKMGNNLSGWTGVCVFNRLTESKLGGESSQVPAYCSFSDSTPHVALMAVSV